MANSIRNITTLYGPLDEADRFIGRFMRGGMEAFVPLAADSTTLRDCREMWGACPEYGDFEILSESAIIAGQLNHESRPKLNSTEANWLNYNSFTPADHHESMTALDLPGFLGREERPVALIVFHTQWGIPNRWIEAVINAEYRRGLLLHIQSYDIIANCEMHKRGGSCDHFHSYTTVGDTRHVQSGNCSILIKVETMPGSMEDDDFDEDIELPLIDEDGNELPSIELQQAPAA
jgi:hypothetical protein